MLLIGTICIIKNSFIYKMKLINFFFIAYIVVFFPQELKSQNIQDSISGKKNFLHEFETFNLDGTINVVIKIPAGGNQKWEVSKIDGTLRWERRNNSYRVIKYLPYVSNYGFIPQTLQPENLGGDGEPVDVVLLGKSYERGSVIKSKILGVLLMTDEGKIDNKIIAIPNDSKIFFHQNLNSIEDLNKNYPGILEILKIWFQNYKRTGQVEIQSYDDSNKALEIIKASQKPYEILRGYWLENN